jgi:hypothetical protein
MHSKRRVGVFAGWPCDILRFRNMDDEDLGGDSAIIQPVRSAPVQVAAETIEYCSTAVASG